MNQRFVAFVSHSSTAAATYMVCILVDRAQVDTTRYALRTHERTIGRAGQRFEDLTPAQQEASMAFFAGMRVLGAVVLRTDLEAAEAEITGRSRVLQAAARYARQQAADHFVVDDTLDRALDDGACIDRATEADPLSHEHGTLDADPLLWIPQAIAHLVAHGEPTIDDVPGWLQTGMIVV